MKRVWFSSLLVIVTMLAGMIGMVSSASAEPATFNDPNMQIVWERTDRPVEMFVTQRSYMWGPNTLAGSPSTELYANSPGGNRTVQYFDKSRMEVNNPNGDRSNLFFITNGLLVREMVSGEIQLGDTQFQPKPPALEAVAGDPAPVNPDSPNYRTFHNIASLNNDNPSPDRQGQAIVESIDKSGTISTTTSPDPSVTYGQFEPTLQHNIANKFVDFLNQTGPIFVNGAIEQNQPVVNGVFLAGLPITDAYWVKAKVAGVEKDVLVQLFERRVLTYTPSNPQGFQVEMGNVGQHYFRWRYGSGPTTEERIVFASDRSGTSQIYSMKTDGTDVKQLTTAGPNFGPRWSPDNLQIVFRSARNAADEIWVMNADGSNQTKLTPGPFDGNPNWSANGTRIIFSRAGSLWSMNTNGSDLVQLTTGTNDDFPQASPDGAKIAFQSQQTGNVEVWVMNVDGTNQTKLTDRPTTVDIPFDWKGNKILFQSFPTTFNPKQIWVMNGDGTDQTKVLGDDDLGGTFSPDMSRVVFELITTTADNLWVANADGSNAQQLTNTAPPHGDFSADWSN
jgi:Tol biopolymer transport system component